MFIKNLAVTTAMAMCLSATAAIAGVPADVADRLDKDLNPMGAQRSGNAAGTIPDWTGGLSQPPADANYKIGDRHPDPYASDPILFTINSANMDQYADNLTETSAAMLKTYPDTYKMNVYKSHRSCAQPPAIYAVTKQNALNSRLLSGGDGLEGAIRATAFPIPSTAQEMMWNHKLKFRNFKLTRQFAAASPTRGGNYTLVTVQDEVLQNYSDPSKNDIKELNNISLKYIANTIAPARRAGNVVLIHETIDQRKGNRKAWVYSPGTRRVRRAPNIAYDNPGTNSDGLQTTDSFGMFNGAVDRYDWTVVGRGEYYMPANSYALAQRDVQYDQIFVSGGHINQDLPRYELTRAWVVEANLRNDTRHIYKKRKFWVEPDAWLVLNTSQYDNRGELWRLQEAFPQTFYEVPACLRVGETTYDLNAGRYLARTFINQETQINFFADELNEERYTPDAIRRLGVR